MEIYRNLCGRFGHSESEHFPFTSEELETAPAKITHVTQIQLLEDEK